jgi:hypothetical protein
MYHAPGRVYGWRGSMAAALQTLRHAHDERLRQSIQHVPARLERRTTGSSLQQRYRHHARRRRALPVPGWGARPSSRPRPAPARGQCSIRVMGNA